MDNPKRFELTFPFQNSMQYPLRRIVRIVDRNINFEDDRGQCIEFDRMEFGKMEFGKIVQYAFASRFIQIVGADIDVINTDIFEYREDRRR